MNLIKETERVMGNMAIDLARYPVGTKMETPSGVVVTVTKAADLNRTLTYDGQDTEVTVNWMLDSINIDGCKIVD